VGQRTIGQILGHAAGNVTETYIKRHLPTMRRALEKLERAIWGEAEQRELAKVAKMIRMTPKMTHAAKNQALNTIVFRAL
jgi:hypothetical protein